MGYNAKRTRLACFSVSVAMAVVANLPPLLFLTFHRMYGISYTLLGSLVFINFFSQLVIDLIFSFFSYKFNIEKTVKSIPVLNLLGFLLFILSPSFGRFTYPVMLFATLVFSSAAGLGEVLMSPVVAAIPSDNPEREMSILHSMFAWGTLAVVIVSTLFLFAFGSHNWRWLMLIFTACPLLSFFLFKGQKIPEIPAPQKLSGVMEFAKNKGVWFCVIAMFFAGAAECTLEQWCSGFLELSFGIPKVIGDVFGVAMFALMLGLGRSMYAKRGKCIERVLTLGSLGTVMCYIGASISTSPVLGIIFCAFTGFCTSMLWPGSLIVSSDRFPQGGMFIYAIMAAGGDLGASVGPQIVGIVTDLASASNPLAHLGLEPSVIGIKLGILVSALFPLIAFIIYLRIWKTKKFKK